MRIQNCKKTYRGHDTAVVHLVAPSRGAEIGLHQIRLHGHLGRPIGDIKLLRDDLLDQRGGQGRNSLNHRGLRASETLLLVVEGVALAEVPGPVVLDPVVLVVPRVGGEVKQAERRLEGAVEFAPFDLDAVVVEVGQAGCQGSPVVLAAAQRWHGVGEAKSVLDKVHTDGVRANLRIHS